MENTLKAYFQKDPEVVAVYLFGSRAVGRHRADSDVDIGVLLRAPDVDFHEKFQERVTVELSCLLRKDIHTVIMNNAGELLMKQILTHGRQVLINDIDKLRRFLMSTVTRIAEFGHYQKAFQRGIIKSLQEEAHG